MISSDAAALVRLLDSLGIGLVAAGPTHVTDASPAFCAMVGLSLAEVCEVGRTARLLAPEDRVRIAELEAAALAGGKDATMRVSLLNHLGERVPADLALALGVGSEGQAEAVVAVVDRTEQARLSRDLDRHIALLDCLPLAIGVWDAGQADHPLGMRLRFANRETLRLFDRDLVSAVGCTLVEIYPPIDPDDAARMFALRGTSRIEHFSEIVVAAEGHPPARLRWRAAGLPDGLVAAVGVDVTTERAEEQRRHSLVQRLVEVSDAERERLAINLHDDSIQQLTAAAILVEGMRRRPDSPELAERLEAADAAIRQTISGLRRIVFELAPPELARSGLAAAVRSAVDLIFAGSEVEVELDVRLDERPPEGVQTVALRIVAEALTNARRHAQAERVSVTISERNQRLIVAVADDGIGLGSEGEPGHIGLRSMRERAESVGGEFLIGPNAGAATGRVGTYVSAVLPFEGLRILSLPTTGEVDVGVPRSTVEALRRELRGVSDAAAQAHRRAATARGRLFEAIEIMKLLIEPLTSVVGVADVASKLIAERVHDGCCVRFLSAAEGLTRVASWHPDPEQLRYLDQTYFGDRPGTSGYEHLVVRSAAPTLLDWTTAKWLASNQEPPPGPLRVHSSIIAPLVGGGHTRGTLTVVRDGTDLGFDEDDVEYLTCLATQVELACARAERVEASREELIVWNAEHG